MRKTGPLTFQMSRKAAYHKDICFISLFQCSKCFLFVQCYSSHSRETGMRGRKQRYSPWPFSPIPLPLLSSNRLVTDTKPKPKTGIRIAVFAIHWDTNHSSFFSLNNLSNAMTNDTLQTIRHDLERPIITLN